MPDDIHSSIQSLIPDDDVTTNTQDPGVQGASSPTAEASKWPNTTFGETGFVQETLPDKEEVQETLYSEKVLTPVEKPVSIETTPEVIEELERKADVELPPEVVKEIKSVHTHVVDKTKKPENLHDVTTLADTLTKFADKEESDFITEVLKEHKE